MSSDSIFTNFPAITGGIPIGADLAPSIIFTIAFALLLPAAIWRTIQCRRPGRLCFLGARLILFIIVRIVTFSIRAAEAEHVTQNGGNPTPQIGLFIAEQIFLGIGFIVLINNLVDYLKFQLVRTDCGPAIVDPNGPQHSRLSLGNIQRLMHVALIVAVILGIVAGTEYNSALTNPGGSAASEVRTFRVASTAISLACAALVALCAVFILFAHTHLPRRSSIYLCGVALIMLVIPAYRLSVTLETSHSLDDLVSTHTRVLFYVLQALFEWIATLALLIPDMRTFFGVPGTLITPAQPEYDTQYKPTYAATPLQQGHNGYPPAQA